MLIKIVAVITCAFASNVAAACSVQSSAARPHLVELYSSEGCDSCPPAERWMSSLLKHPDIVGLEFHVDYWDSVGWNDPFSQHAFTLRQQLIAKRGNRDEIYTPQVWVDGHIWRNWPKGAPPDAADGAAPTITLQIDPNEAIHVSVAAIALGAAADYHTYVALTENNLARDVRGGENRGKHLNHDEVVRAFSGPLDFPNTETTLNAVENLVREQAAVVAFVQNERDGSVVQVVRMPLAQCVKQKTEERK